MKYEYDCDKIKKQDFKKKVELLEELKLIRDDYGNPLFDVNWITKKFLKISNDELKEYLRKEEIKKRKDKIKSIINLDI